MSGCVGAGNQQAAWGAEDMRGATMVGFKTVGASASYTPRYQVCVLTHVLTRSEVWLQIPCHVMSQSHSCSQVVGCCVHGTHSVGRQHSCRSCVGTLAALRCLGCECGSRLMLLRAHRFRRCMHIHTCLGLQGRLLRCCQAETVHIAGHGLRVIRQDPTHAPRQVGQRCAPADPADRLCVYTLEGMGWVVGWLGAGFGGLLQAG